MVRPPKIIVGRTGGEAGATLCIWGVTELGLTGFSKTRSMWWLLNRFLRKRHFSQLKKIIAVRQRDGVTRFDVFVDRQHLKHVLQAIRKAFPSWYIREHRSFADRMAVRYPKQPHPPPLSIEASDIAPDPMPDHPSPGSSSVVPTAFPVSTIALNVVTFNVNGLSKKREFFRHYLSRLSRRSMAGGPDVLCVQETRVQQGHWSFDCSGYRIVQSCAKPDLKG